MDEKHRSRATGYGKQEGASWLHRLRTRLLPEMPDFYGLLVEQCETTARGTGAMVDFFGEPRPDLADRIRELEHEGDRLKLRNLEILHHSFATPMDREDFYQAVEGIDEILNYAKAAVEEVELFELGPDDHAAAMAAGVHSGTLELLECLKVLAKLPATAERHARAAMKSERGVEKAYRGALVELFDPDRMAGAGDYDGTPAPGAEARLSHHLLLVSQVFKRREIYRHLSNAADHVARAAQVMEDVIAKAS
ncbi:MAG: DUF47 family protein [Gemmatimonadota bacterium]